jgi:hypothetical protein
MSMTTTREWAGRRALGYWLLMLAAMVANGAFREGVLLPMLGNDVAQIVSALSGIGIITGLSHLYVRPLAHPTTRHLAGVAGLWLVLTVAFEFLFGRYVVGHSWAELWSNYDVTAGNLWPFVLASVAAAPLLWGAYFRRSTRASVGA